MDKLHIEDLQPMYLFLLVYDVASLGNWFPMFRDKVMVWKGRATIDAASYPRSTYISATSLRHLELSLQLCLRNSL
jgi:hypothetical protein